jgi:pyruvate kinase
LSRGVLYCAALGLVHQVASSAVKTSIDLDAPLIIACTETGNSVRYLMKYRPKVRL